MEKGEKGKGEEFRPVSMVWLTAGLFTCYISWFFEVFEGILLLVFVTSIFLHEFAAKMLAPWAQWAGVMAGLMCYFIYNTKSII